MASEYVFACTRTVLVVLTNVVGHKPNLLEDEVGKGRVQQRYGKSLTGDLTDRYRFGGFRDYDSERGRGKCFSADQHFWAPGNTYVI